MSLFPIVVRPVRLSLQPRALTHPFPSSSSSSLTPFSSLTTTSTRLGRPAASFFSTAADALHAHHPLSTPPSTSPSLRSLFPLQTPFTSLLDSTFATLERDLARTQAALLSRADFAQDEQTQKLLDWTHAGPTGEQQGASTYRSVEIVKSRGEDGKWKVDVFASDAAAPEGSPLKEGKLVASGEGEDEQAAVKQAADKALEVIQSATKAIEGAKPGVEGE
ncbi:hypothetical protein JCM8097_004949 [Rhodosporidiobolus ruineniae]